MKQYSICFFKKTTISHTLINVVVPFKFLLFYIICLFFIHHQAIFILVISILNSRKRIIKTINFLKTCKDNNLMLIYIVFTKYNKLLFKECSEAYKYNISTSYLRKNLDPIFRVSEIYYPFQ